MTTNDPPPQPATPEPLHGLLVIDKPSGLTSARTLYRVRALTRQRKSGHAGSLDPFATGVLVLCLGRATRLVERLMDQPKVYRAVARLDVTCDSFDPGTRLRDVPVTKPPALEAIHQALATCEARTEQVPPVFSALKIKGLPAYKRVHLKEDVDLPPRPVRIYWLHLRAYQWPELAFDMACGRGTYVRAVIRDIGELLGTGGMLTGLRRTRIGPFDVDNAIPLDDLARTPRPESSLIPLEEARTRLDPDAIVIPPRPTGDAS